MLPKLEEIKVLRKNLNISQEELAVQCNLTQSTVSRIENGKEDPPYSKVKRIFNFLEGEKTRRRNITKTIKDIVTEEIISLSPKDSLKDAITLMSQYNISQLPVFEDSRNFGSITAKKAQKLIMENPDLVNVKIKEVKELPFPEVEENWNLRDVSDMLLKYPAVLVKKFDKYTGIITDADFL
ncbi:MAG: helix-turn-helix domain-containing protein [Promethearchaeota archaeon]|nr:MAG: helix-turn-helix domain-containing protein [Candidatus Lokiarchaeota archaeon]